MSGTYILGANGHGRVVLSVLRSNGGDALGFYDDAPELSEAIISGLSVLGRLEDFGRLSGAEAIIGIGDCKVRRMVASKFRDILWAVAVHAHSWVDPLCTVALGSVVCAGAVVQVGAQIGAHCIINTGATVDHDCRIGNFVHICPGVHLGGNVTVGNGSWLGIGSQVIQGITIGKNVMVAAGATVVRDISDNAVVMGTPARIVRHQSC
ncbi:MAG: acetyltransferase [Desulfomicrobium sp.]|nr:acetyltransferase [Pseudomonadota bacterium]MBV1713003.1 acetyltransferase [Desulfomicrobium sp.]MBU4571973.1 acetyltransferase [Pseudomonadota bacterium]MBU4596122.1 acetyltransferase [Pseudomonadota bacterium]MBV1721426.1 acetyltransferase [Desulfomicrobium sp.]